MLESLFNQVAGLKGFIKKRLQNKCFPVNIAKFLRTTILKNICEWWLLDKTVLKNFAKFHSKTSAIESFLSDAKRPRPTTLLLLLSTLFTIGIDIIKQTNK